MDDERLRLSSELYRAALAQMTSEIGVNWDEVRSTVSQWQVLPQSVTEKFEALKFPVPEPFDFPGVSFEMPKLQSISSYLAEQAPALWAYDVRSVIGTLDPEVLRAAAAQLPDPEILGVTSDIEVAAFIDAVGEDTAEVDALRVVLWVTTMATLIFTGGGYMVMSDAQRTALVQHLALVGLALTVVIAVANSRNERG